MIECRSPSIHAPGGVNEHICRTCAIRDHGPPLKPLVARDSTSLLKTDCVHRSQHSIDSILCPSCRGGKTKLLVYACDKHGKCMIGKTMDGIKSCVGCQEYEKKPEDKKKVPTSFASLLLTAWGTRRILPT